MKVDPWEQEISAARTMVSDAAVVLVHTKEPMAFVKQLVRLNGTVYNLLEVQERHRLSLQEGRDEL